MFVELDDNVSEREDSIGEVLVSIIPEIFRQVMFSVRCLLQLQSSRAASTSRICVKSRIYALGRRDTNLPFRNGAVFAERAPLQRVGVPPRLRRKLATYTDSQSTDRPTGLKLTKVSHAEHDLAKCFGCDGDKIFPDAVFHFTDIVIQFREQFLSRAFA